MRALDIVERIRAGLGNSPLAQFTTYSNLGSIFRAIGIAIAEREETLVNEIDGFYISSATGTDLDRRAADFDIYRSRGTSARGNVLITPPYDIEIQTGLILTDASQGIQYRVLAKGVVKAGTERTFPIESLTITDRANLPAGTNLYSTPFPTTRFVVGDSTDPITNIATGGLSGASSLESDEAFRTRVLSTLIARSLASRPAILSRAQEIVSGVWLDNYEVGGYLNIMVNTRDEGLIKRLTDTLYFYIAAGIRYRVLPLEMTPLDIEVVVAGGVPPSRVKEAIKSLISLQPPGSLIGPLLIEQALETVNVEIVEIVAPSTTTRLASNAIPLISSLRVLVE